jgi:hypothetical protein
LSDRKKDTDAAIKYPEDAQAKQNAYWNVDAEKNHHAVAFCFANQSLKN